MTTTNRHGNPEGALACFKAELTEKDFEVFSKFIYSEYGIKMPPIKRIMLQGRLLKRIRELNMKSYSEYKEYFFSQAGQEKELLHFLRSEEHTSELQSRPHLVCRLLLEKK